MLYMIKTVPAFIFYPAVCLWSVTFGMVAGVLFKLLAVIENWWSVNRTHVLLWKKYPQRSYRKYINSLWAIQVRGRPLEMAEYTRSMIEQRNPTEPFPVTRILINTLLMLGIAPFMALSGLIDGPLYVFRRGVALRNGELPLQSDILS